MRVRLNDDDFIDEIHIRTIPRFKTSGLSGDEWRHSIQVIALRKGRLIGEHSWNKLDWALERLLPWINDELLSPIDKPDISEDRCDQPGCSEPWTVLYRMTKRACGKCGNQEMYAGSEEHPYLRAFCERHAHRGDSDLDDMDSIYEPIMTGKKPDQYEVNEDDISPSVFGGIIELGDNDE